ncbi:MAG: protease modulator HflC [Sedimentisphaerales bacterium]|nr:protease modulator HflC [Sedimentisphaerales bacterium]
MRKLVIFIPLIVILLIVGLASVYVVQEGQQAVITQFGKPVREVTKAGLNFKTPFIQKIHRMEKRLLPWDGDPENMQTRDKKRIFIDVWARWKISDPMKFFQAVRTEMGGYKILDDLVDSAVRDVVARYNLIQVVRSTDDELFYESEELEKDQEEEKQQQLEKDEEKKGQRANMEEEILEAAGTELEERYGMKLTVVHIKRINYIESVRRTVYDRMKSERLRIARLFESEAEEEKNKILGRTRKELDQIEGEMEQKTAEIRGGADAEVIRIAAEGYSQSPEFYEFLRSLKAYKKALMENSRLILSTDNPFLKQLSAGQGKRGD